MATTGSRVARRSRRRRSGTAATRSNTREGAGGHQRDEREVQARQSQRGQTDEDADQPGDDTRDQEHGRDTEAGPQLVEANGHPRADRQQHELAQRDHPDPPDQQAETERHERVDHDRRHDLRSSRGRVMRGQRHPPFWRRNGRPHNANRMTTTDPRDLAHTLRRDADSSVALARSVCSTVRTALTSRLHHDLALAGHPQDRDDRQHERRHRAVRPESTQSCSAGEARLHEADDEAARSACTHSDLSWPISAAASAGITRKVRPDDVEADQVRQQQPGDRRRRSRSRTTPPLRRAARAHRAWR